MATFDEAAWRADTAWQGTAPSHAEMWAVLNDPSVASDFCAAVAARVGRSELLATASLHALRAAGISGSALLDEYRRVSGRQVRQATIDRLLKAPLTRRARWNNSFANLVSGRFTELVFEATYSTPLREVGVVVEDATTDRSFVDYRLVAADNDESFALSINVKNAGRQMRLARTFFGLDPEDTLPMATYKAFGAADADIPPLLYVYLVDWTLLERLREAYWLRSLSAGEQEVFRLMTTFQGFPRDLEDEFVASTVERRLDRLLAEVGYTESSDLPFRVISAARCHAIFYEHHERSPYVFIKRMETDPNVHISVKHETIAFHELIRNYLSSASQRADLILGLGRTKAMAIPDPPI